jgi:glycosyltransferase involved in cell wall biosynthesis
VIPSVAAGTGGTERCASALLAGLARRGHRVTIFTADSRGSNLPGVDIRRVPRIAGPSPLAYASFLAAAALRRRAQDPFDLVYSAGANTLGADVVTAHYSAARGRRLMRSGELALEGSGLRKLARGTFFSLAERAERRLYRSAQCRRIIAVSRRLRDELTADYRLPPEKLVIVPNGVDLEEFRPDLRASVGRDKRRELGLGEGEILALFLGGDWERKGLATLLQAIGGVRAAVRLVVVGQGDAPYWRKRAEVLGVAGRVRFAPPTSQASAWLAAADFLVLPTRYEPFGLTPLEAAACGVPALFSRLAGVSEILPDGRASQHLHNPLDATELAEKMGRLASDAGLRSRLGSAARSVAERWSWSRATEEVEQVLLAVLDEKGKDAREQL